MKRPILITYRWKIYELEYVLGMCSRIVGNDGSYYGTALRTLWKSNHFTSGVHGPRMGKVTSEETYSYNL